jgi:hypothetical protein
MGRLVVLLFSVLVVSRLLVLVTTADDAAVDRENVLESERQLKRMVSFVTPLMAIVRKDERIKRQINIAQIDRHSQSYVYSGGYQESYSYGKNKDDYVAILSLASLGLLFLFLITLLSTTTFSSGRKKRDQDHDNLIQHISHHDISKKKTTCHF